MKPFAESFLPTSFGVFRFSVFKAEPNIEHVVLSMGEFGDGDPVLCRVHSECLTGEVFSSLKCDCKGQLDLALEQIAAAKRGLLVYLRQEGRGIGLGNKIKAYALQSQGYDSVDANRALGFGSDQRDYSVLKEILAYFNIDSVNLMTNNPAKIAAMEAAGVAVTNRLRHRAKDESKEAQAYLQTKRERMGHLD
jgi:GTP cyclohydrolase II